MDSKRQEPGNEEGGSPLVPLKFPADQLEQARREFLASGDTRYDPPDPSEY